MEWTVLLLPETSKERRKIGRQAGGVKKGRGGKGLWKQLNIEQGWMD